MIKFTTHGNDTNPESPIQKIMEGALGKAQIVDSAPTTAINSIPEGELQFYSGNLYTKQEGSVYKIALTLV